MAKSKKGEDDRDTPEAETAPASDRVLRPRPPPMANQVKRETKQQGRSRLHEVIPYQCERDKFYEGHRHDYASMDADLSRMEYGRSALGASDLTTDTLPVVRSEIAQDMELEKASGVALEEEKARLKTKAKNLKQRAKKAFGNSNKRLHLYEMYDLDPDLINAFLNHLERLNIALRQSGKQPIVKADEILAEAKQEVIMKENSEAEQGPITEAKRGPAPDAELEEVPEVRSKGMSEMGRDVGLVQQGLAAKQLKRDRRKARSEVEKQEREINIKNLFPTQSEREEFYRTPLWRNNNFKSIDKHLEKLLRERKSQQEREMPRSPLGDCDIKLEDTPEPDEMPAETLEDAPVRVEDEKRRRRTRVKMAFPDTNERQNFYEAHLHDPVTIDTYLDTLDRHGGTIPAEMSAVELKPSSITKGWIERAIPNSHDRTRFRDLHEEYDHATVEDFAEDSRLVDVALRVMVEYGDTNEGSTDDTSSSSGADQNCLREFEEDLEYFLP